MCPEVSVRVRGTTDETSLTISVLGEAAHRRPLYPFRLPVPPDLFHRYRTRQELRVGWGCACEFAAQGLIRLGRATHQQKVAPVVKADGAISVAVDRPDKLVERVLAEFDPGAAARLADFGFPQAHVAVAVEFAERAPQLALFRVGVLLKGFPPCGGRGGRARSRRGGGGG